MEPTRAKLQNQFTTAGDSSNSAQSMRQLKTVPRRDGRRRAELEMDTDKHLFGLAGPAQPPAESGAGRCL